jgi:NAD(P)-dependent dehydrogenase (short-subunit alcohol dehydrogenase family)
MPWSTHDIPDQSGRTAVVTGANSGLGYCTARELARRGARVLLACRSERRGKEAVERLHAEVGGGCRTGYRHLDLADLSSVREFAAELDGDRLDLLINNAGLMAPPYGQTADGFETQFGVNHLGHFALTGLLLPRLTATPGSRVVSVSSGMHALADIDLGDLSDLSDLPSDLGDLGAEHRYRRWIAYGRSKTANLLFVHELARRLAGTGTNTPVAAAAHPGYASTNLQTRFPKQEGRRVAERVMDFGNRVFAQSAAAGALPTLYAATAPDVAPGSFTGPRLLGWRGSPAPSWRAARTRDDRRSELLWAASEQLTGVSYDFG